MAYAVRARVLSTVGCPAAARGNASVARANGPGHACRHRSDHRHRDATRRARVRRAGVGRHDRWRRRSAMASRRSTCPKRLSRVPGVFAANRQNYAQDLQISSRGFGARATFGVRGVRLYQDGIPVTMPDGQGQTGSFSLLSAERIEVLRGPFSDAVRQRVGRRDLRVHRGPAAVRRYAEVIGGGGSYGTWQPGRQARRRAGRHVGAVVAASEFVTDGYREHSSARRDIANAKLVLRPVERDAHHARRKHAIPAGDAGPARDSRARNGRESAQRPIRRRPSSTRARRSTRRRRRAALDQRFSDDLQLHVDCVRRTPAGSPVPCAVRHRRDIVGRRRGSRSRLRRRRCAARVAHRARSGGRSR